MVEDYAYAFNVILFSVIGQIIERDVRINAVVKMVVFIEVGKPHDSFAAFGKLGRVKRAGNIDARAIDIVLFKLEGEFARAHNTAGIVSDDNPLGSCVNNFFAVAEKFEFTHRGDAGNAVRVGTNGSFVVRKNRLFYFYAELGQHENHIDRAHIVIGTAALVAVLTR